MARVALVAVVALAVAALALPTIRARNAVGDVVDELRSIEMLATLQFSGGDTCASREAVLPAGADELPSRRTDVVANLVQLGFDQSGDRFHRERDDDLDADFVTMRSTPDGLRLVVEVFDTDFVICAFA